MPKVKVSPTVISYSAAISACEKGAQWERALTLFQAMPKAKIPSDVISCNAAISACEKGGQWEQALTLFHAMPKEKILSDVISYSAAISACEKGGQWEQALTLFQGMQEAKIPSDVISYSSAISACEKGGQWEQALLLFQGMPAARISLNVISYSAAISACEKGAQWEQALLLFQGMPAARISLNVISYNAAISACEKGGQWEQALTLFQAMSRAKISSDVITYNAAISACEKGGQWEQALTLFHVMPKAKISPNVISYNASISACEKGGQWKQALTLFQGMPKAKISPYVTSFNAAISACEKGGQWEQALALFQAISKAKISPNVISYNAAISACEKGERFHQMSLATKLPLVHMRMVNEKRPWPCLRMFEVVIGSQLDPDIVSYNALARNMSPPRLLLGLYCIEICSKRLGGDMFLAMAWSCVGAFVQSGVGPHESSQSANSVGTNWCTNRSFDPWWFFQQMVMCNALTKKKTDRRTMKNFSRNKTDWSGWGQSNAARMNSSTLIDTILYSTNHVCSDDVFTLDRAVSRSFRTRSQGLILRCHHTSRTVSSIVITWCMPSVWESHALSITPHLHFIGLQVLRVWRSKLGFPTIMGYSVYSFIHFQMEWPQWNMSPCCDCREFCCPKDDHGSDAPMVIVEIAPRSLSQPNVTGPWVGVHKATDGVHWKSSTR